MRDIMNHLHVVMGRAPQAAVTDNTAMAVTRVDLKGYDSCMLVLQHGTNADADATYTVLVEDSDDDVSYAAVADAYLNGTEVLAGFQFDDDVEVRKIGYTGSKRYVKATVTPAGNTGNAFVSAVWVLGHPSRQPTANPPQ